MSKMTIKCNRCGLLFEQTPNNHLSGQGCPKCAKEKLSELFRSNSEEFVKKAKGVHKDSLYKYFYDNFKYVNNHTKGTITCEKHGDFEQSPSDHLRGYGCPECGKEKIGNANKSNLEEFEEKAKIVHNNFYDYSNVDYIHNKKKVKIICPIHGEFEQTPANHLSGQGCPECAKEHLREIQREIQNIKWSDRYDEGILYLIECWNDVEKFIKIGITSRSVEERYRYDMPYQYKVLKEIPLDSKSCIEYEQYIIDICESYEPKITFGGYSECISIDEKYYLKDLLENLKNNL